MLQLIDEAIRLELNVAKIYLDFSKRFAADKGFWWQIAIEEQHHADLLRSGKQYFLNAMAYPKELLDASLATLNNLNSEMEITLGQKNDVPLSREFAFNFALELEAAAGEAHQQQAALKAEHPLEAIQLFQRLNNADIDHTDRIRSYMRQNNISVTCH